MTEIEIISNKLKSSPLFYLFLSSRELFHSNFWFWLSKLNVIETYKLFSHKPIGNLPVEFKREFRQKNGENKAVIDLYVVDRIVIENKVKDFPTSDQLERIKKSFFKTEIEFVLTTLFWTNDLSFDGWTVKTYKDISTAIVPENFTTNKYFQNIISDYKDFTLNLAELTEQLTIMEKYDFSISENKELFGQLNEIKLWEGYQKLRASHLLLHYRNFNIHNIRTGYSVHNQKATIDFSFELIRDYVVGIQIEDNQYRKFVVGEKVGDKTKKFAENLIDNNLFLNKMFTGRGGKSFLNFGDIFKYQYEIIENITFDDLFVKINNDIQFIKDNRENLIKLISDS